MPRNLPALKGRDKSLEAAEATFRGGRCLVISPLQGLLPERMGSRSSPRPLAHRRYLKVQGTREPRSGGRN